MTPNQRVTLMADWWPRACRAQGWPVTDRARRLAVLSTAVNRPLTSANELDSTRDIDAVKAHLGFLANNVSATIETDAPNIGRARRLRRQISDGLRCLALYHPNVAGWLAEVIKDKFRHGSRAMPSTVEDLTAEPLPGRQYSQLDQMLMTLSRAVQAKRKEQGDTVHAMKLRAGVRCDCKSICQKPPRRVFAASFPMQPVCGAATSNEPF